MEAVFPEHFNGSVDSIVRTSRNDELMQHMEEGLGYFLLGTVIARSEGKDMVLGNEAEHEKYKGLLKGMQCDDIALAGIEEAAHPQSPHLDFSVIGVYALNPRCPLGTYQSSQ